MTRYAKTMSQALAEVQVRELKMNDPKLIKVFDKLKPKDTIKLKVSSGISKGKDFQPYTVRAKNTLRNGVEKITMILQGNPTGVKRFLYKKDGKVTFAIGDMAASIDDIKEEIEEGTWKYAETPKEIAALKKLMSRPLPFGKGGENATSAVYNLLGDDELSDMLYADGEKNPKGDARKTIIKWFKQRVKDDSYGLGDETKELGKKIGLKMDYVPEEVELDEALKGFRVDFGKGMTKGSATYKNKKDAEEFAARRKRLGELPVKITQVTVKNANMFDDPMGPKRKRIPEGYKPIKANHYDVKVTVKDKDVAKVKKIISLFKGDIEDVDSDQVDGGGMKFKGTGDIFIQGDDAGKLGMEIAKAVRTAKVMGEEVELDEGMKYTHVAVDKKGLVIGFASDEKDAKDMARRNDGKVVKLKKPMSDKKGDMMVNRPFKEDLGKEDEPKVKEIIKKLKGASQAHAGQAKDLEKAIDEGKMKQFHMMQKDGASAEEIAKALKLDLKTVKELMKEGNEMTEKLTDGNLSLKETVLKMWQEAVSPAQQAAIAISKKEKEKKEEPDEGNLFTKALKDARDKGEKTFTVAGKTYDVQTEKLVGGQKKLDKDKDGDIDGKDFAMMRKKKNEEYHRYLETKKGSLRDAVLQMWGEEVKEDKKTLTKEKKDGKNKMTDTGKEMTPVEMAPKMPKIKNEKNKV